MSYHQTTIYEPVAFASQFDEVDKALLEYRSRKQHSGFVQQQQHFNNNNLKFKNRNNYHHQKSFNGKYTNQGVPIVNHAGFLPPQQMRPQQAMLNQSSSPTLYQFNNMYAVSSSSSKFEHEETGFMPLNSRLVDTSNGMSINNLSSSVSSGSVSSYSDNGNDFIPNFAYGGNNLSGGNGFGGSGSGFFGTGSNDGYFNELNVQQHAVGKEKSFGFLNIWGNDMSVWA